MLSNVGRAHTTSSRCVAVKPACSRQPAFRLCSPVLSRRTRDNTEGTKDGRHDLYPFIIMNAAREISEAISTNHAFRIGMLPAKETIRGFTTRQQRGLTQKGVTELLRSLRRAGTAPLLPLAAAAPPPCRGQRLGQARRADDAPLPLLPRSCAGETPLRLYDRDGTERRVWVHLAYLSIDLMEVPTQFLVKFIPSLFPCARARGCQSSAPTITRVLCWLVPLA